MKKALLVCLPFFFFAAYTNAQIRKGSDLLGGSISFYAEKNKPSNGADYQTSNFAFMPSYGKAVKTNLVVGGDLLLSTGNNENDISSYDQHAYGAGVFVRQYKELGKNFYLFIQGRLGASVSKTENRNTLSSFDSYDRKGFTIGVSAYPGIAYAINKRLQLETGLNDLLYAQFGHEKTNYLNSSNETKTNRINAGTALSSFSGFTLGLRVLLNHN